MHDILNNAWFISILSGIISSFLFHHIISYFSRKKENITAISTANEKVFESLKSYVAEHGFPSEEIIDSLMQTIAKKNKIPIREMDNVRTIYQRLTTEIINDGFISKEDKQKYNECLEKNTRQRSIPNNAQRIMPRRAISMEPSEIYKKRKYLLAMLVISVFTGIMCGLYIRHKNFPIYTNSTNSEESIELIE